MVESKIPLPTDNIYKFYALFGLILLVSTGTLFLYLHQTTNNLIFEAVIEIEELSTKDNPTKADLKRKEMIAKKVSIAAEEKKGFNNILVLGMSVSLLLIGWGFGKWHTVIQPKQDRLLDLQIQKAEQDLKKQPREPFRRPH